MSAGRRAQERGPADAAVVLGSVIGRPEGVGGASAMASFRADEGRADPGGIAVSASTRRRIGTDGLRTGTAWEVATGQTAMMQSAMQQAR
jgi:hypothetical protein